MNRTPVANSTHIKSLGYSGQTLEVEYSKGDVYEYYDVPRHEYDAIMAAASKGHYIYQHIIKGGKYRYKRLS